MTACVDTLLDCVWVEATGMHGGYDFHLGLQSGNTLAQVLHTFQATRQTPTGKNTDLDLGPISHGGSERCQFPSAELASS